MNKTKLREIFGSEMAQHDPNFTKYALDRTDLLEDLRNSANDLLIINAPRGSGKSGLLIKFEEMLKSSGQRNVIIKKYYADVVFPNQAVTVNQGINYWKNTLLESIVSEIGKDINFAISDDDITAVELSEKLGVKPKNLINTLTTKLKFKGSIIEKCDFDPVINIEKLSRIIEKSEKLYWILLDEMDDIYDNENDNNLLLGLLQACSYIASKFSNIIIRLTIRPHIMTYLRITNGTVQKLNECETFIQWSADQLKTILASRLAYYEKKYPKQMEFTLSEVNNSNAPKDKDSTIISRYFEDFDMSFREGSSSIYRAFATLCFYRPRWMIEFCKEVSKSLEEGDYASLKHYKKAFVPFGNRRIQFLAGEFSRIYPFIQSAISAMVGARQPGFGKTKKLRSAIISRIIDTHIVNVNNPDEKPKVALEIAKALYIVEFLRGKERIAGAGNHHRFYYYVDRPDLLSSWNHEPDILWEIHPTFARAFNITDSDAYTVAGEVKLIGKKYKND